MQKEIRRCQKSEKALEIMYKMYNIRERTIKAGIDELSES